MSLRVEEGSHPSIAAGMGLGILIGAVGAVITGSAANASAPVMAILGGGAGALAGATVATLGRRRGTMGIGLGMLIGFVPGSVIGALVGKESFPGSAGAPVYWGLILGVPTAAAGGVVASRFRRGNS